MRLRTPPRGEQRGPAAQSVFRQVLPAQGVVLVVLVGVATVVVGAVVAEVVVVAVVVVVVVVGAGVGVVLALEPPDEAGHSVRRLKRYRTPSAVFTRVSTVPRLSVTADAPLW